MSRYRLVRVFLAPCNGNFYLRATVPVYIYHNIDLRHCTFIQLCDFISTQPGTLITLFGYGSYMYLIIYFFFTDAVAQSRNDTDVHAHHFGRNSREKYFDRIYSLGYQKVCC